MTTKTMKTLVTFHIGIQCYLKDNLCAIWRRMKRWLVLKIPLSKKTKSTPENTLLVTESDFER